MKVKNEDIRMFRRDLEDIPEYPLPDGLSVRWYERGDEAAWLRINTACDEFNEITPKLFREQYNADAHGEVDHAELGKRMFFLVDDDGKDIGTTSAWYHDDPTGVPRGLIHWAKGGVRASHPTH